MSRAGSFIILSIVGACSLAPAAMYRGAAQEISDTPVPNPAPAAYVPKPKPAQPSKIDIQLEQIERDLDALRKSEGNR